MVGKGWGMKGGFSQLLTELLTLGHRLSYSSVHLFIHFLISIN